DLAKLTTLRELVVDDTWNSRSVAPLLEGVQDVSQIESLTICHPVLIEHLAAVRPMRHLRTLKLNTVCLDTAELETLRKQLPYVRFEPLPGEPVPPPFHREQGEAMKLSLRHGVKWSLSDDGRRLQLIGGAFTD